MTKYVFPSWPGAVITNPIIVIDGDVGTKIKHNKPQPYAFVDILITTDTFKGGFRLTSTEPPTAWDMDALQIWVSEQLTKYEILS